MALFVSSELVGEQGEMGSLVEGKPPRNHLDTVQGILVLGMGNPLRGDDALGHQAIHRLEALVPLRFDLRCLFRPQLTPDLVEDLLPAAAVLFIDATTQDPPGALRLTHVAPVPVARSSTGRGSHGYSPGRLLHLAAELYGHRPWALLCTVGAAGFMHGAPLSTPARAGLDRLITLLMPHLRPSTREGGISTDRLP